ncbi:MAG: nicotinate-nucleotide adenylyltransferase [Firmicutes bacterium]|nr:nicotinate-nucleotide adenylyltransferase [Bacillota bacterium]
MKSIGIMGGTFDPIHNGHIAMAQKVKENYRLDEVVFVPSGNPPHKKERKITTAEHRLAMVKLAIDGIDGFSVSTMEIDRKGYSYALDTVNEFYRIYGDDIDLYFITGADAIAEIATWYRADELMKKCSFIAATRPGYHIDEAYRAVAEKFEDRLFLFRETAHEESSSDIRQRIERGKDISAMLPDAVARYINEHQLYQREL